MNALLEKLFSVYKKEYGQNAQMKEGETQVFVLDDCTVVLSFFNNKMDIKITADNPIKCNFSSGFFKDSEV